MATKVIKLDAETAQDDLYNDLVHPRKGNYTPVQEPSEIDDNDSVIIVGKINSTNLNEVITKIGRSTTAEGGEVFLTDELANKRFANRIAMRTRRKVLFNKEGSKTKMKERTANEIDCTTLDTAGNKQKFICALPNSYGLFQTEDNTFKIPDRDQQLEGLWVPAISRIPEPPTTPRVEATPNSPRLSPGRTSFSI